jgi:hypothetical protein
MDGSCPMTDATVFFVGVAGLGLWAAIVAVFEIIAAWERRRWHRPMIHDISDT